MSKFKDYKAYQQICSLFDEKTANAMMEDASKQESFIDSKDSPVSEIVYWRDTKYEENGVQCITEN